MLDVVYNHLGPAGNYLARVRALLHRPLRHAVGRGGQLRRPGQRRGAALLRRQRPACGCATTTSTACASTPCTPSSTRRPRTSSRSWPIEVDGPERATLGRPLLLIAESDLNDPRLVRRPRGRAATASTRSGATTSTTPCTPCSPASGPGYYADFGSLAAPGQGAAPGLRLRRRATRRFRRRRHGRPPTGRAGLPVPRLPAEPRPGRQPGRRASASATSLSPSRLKVGAALVLTAPFVPMLFQGEEWGASTPFLYFTDHEDPELGRAVQRGPAARVRAVRLGPRGRPRPAGRRRPSQRSKLDWDELDEAGARRAARLAPLADRAAPAPPRAAATVAWTACTWTRTTSAGTLVAASGPA